jgi:NitT/TauT family transport system substrate-binding protein
VVEALLNGSVDAVCTWEPYSHIIRERLGGNAAVFKDRDLYILTWNVAVAHQFARDNPELVVRFLRALDRADRFIMDDRKEAYAISGEYMGTDVHLYDREWNDYSFRTLLDESLMLVLEDQARWMVRESIVESGILPNFVDHVYTPGLRAVRPEAVTIAGQ